MLRRDLDPKPGRCVPLAHKTHRLWTQEIAHPQGSSTTTTTPSTYVFNTSTTATTSSIISVFKCMKDHDYAFKHINVHDSLQTHQRLRQRPPTHQITRTRFQSHQLPQQSLQAYQQTRQSFSLQTNLAATSSITELQYHRMFQWFNMIYIWQRKANGKLNDTRRVIQFLWSHSTSVLLRNLEWWWVL